MKNTKENVIKLLQEVMRNSSLAEEYSEEKGDEKVATYCRGEKVALLFAISLLQDNEYFTRVYKMYFKGRRNYDENKRKEDI